MRDDRGALFFSCGDCGRCLRVLAMAVLVAMLAVGPSWSSPLGEAKAQHRRAGKHPPKDLAGSFQSFCKEWMEKVWARDPQSLIKWQTEGDGVQGTYVEYSPDYTCTLTQSDPPVGRVVYREVRYEKRGKTIAEAERSLPRPIEIFDTGEFFSYMNGQWTY